MGTKFRVDLINTNGDKLRKDLRLEKSGLEDGSTITALLKKSVPTVLRNNTGATAELKADGTVTCTGASDLGSAMVGVPLSLARYRSLALSVALTLAPLVSLA